MWLIAGSPDHFSCLRPSKYINNGRTGWIFLSLICLQPANLATNSSGGRGGWCRWSGGGGGGGGVLVSKSANCSHRPAAAAFQPSQCAGTSPGLSCPVLSSLQSPIPLTLSSLPTSRQPSSTRIISIPQSSTGDGRGALPSGWLFIAVLTTRRNRECKLVAE